MLVIVGFVIVIASILGGYLIEKGNVLVLLQPAELLIIGGAATGALIVGNPTHVLKTLLASPVAVLRGSRYPKTFYVDALRLLNEFFSAVRKKGMAGVENDIEEPDNSELFRKFPQFLANQSMIRFFCDTIRTVTTGAVGHHELDLLMEMDIETQHKGAHVPVGALSTMADGLPGLGIVAAVMGIILTMGALGGPPEQIGHRVAAALVGTFLGVLLCYGFVGPLASRIGKLSEEETECFQCLRMGISSFVKGAPPVLAIEFARRVIPVHVRPTFQEMEAACQKDKEQAASEAA
jgi:chemotaxis protein MotA